MSDNTALAIVLVALILGITSCAAVSEYAMHRYATVNCPNTQR